MPSRPPAVLWRMTFVVGALTLSLLMTFATSYARTPPIVPPPGLPAGPPDGSPMPPDAPAAGPGVSVQKPDEVVRYQPATPQEHASAIAAARTFARDSGERAKLTFTTLETDRFLIFTDWDAREHAFLKKSMEEAYRAVARQFDVPATRPDQTIFVGKLPVFMVARQEDFQRLMTVVADFRPPDGVLGLYGGKPDGTGVLAMWKPTVATPGQSARSIRADQTRDAERRWARTLVHEFTHAFLARWRTNRPIPRWLNEGTAELIADEMFPDPRGRQWARWLAQSRREVGEIFDDDVMPPGELYPVMMTLVEGLASEDRRRFLRLFELIKDGTEAEAAVKQLYGVDYTGLESAWRQYASRMGDRRVK